MDADDEEREQAGECPAEIRKRGERALPALGLEPVGTIGDVDGAREDAREPGDEGDEKKREQRRGGDHDRDVSVARRPGVGLVATSEMGGDLSRQGAGGGNDERSAADGEGDEERNNETTHGQLTSLWILSW
jgi:hypothetical protein